MDEPRVDGLVDHLFRSEYGKLVAVLTPTFGFRNLDVAEELVQETLLTAMRDWSFRGVPDSPEAWLMTVAKNKARNHIRGEVRKRSALQALGTEGAAEPPPEVTFSDEIEDSLLRMIFACCHPSIGPADQLALILKTLVGFSTPEIASALLVGDEAINKRLYRAKKQIREQNVALEVPGGAELEPRLAAACNALYLLYNEGYYSSGAATPIRKDLCLEAMRLTKLLVEHFPDQPRIPALLSLMCFHTARFESRVDAAGELVVFAEQDRSSWDAELIALGIHYLTSAASGTQLTRFHLEASIAAQHCTAPSFAETNWGFIKSLYERLLELQPHPLVRLNIAIVDAQLSGATDAITDVTKLLTDRKLKRSPLAHTTLGELHRLEGDLDSARQHLQAALELAGSEHERAFLVRKLSELADA